MLISCIIFVGQICTLTSLTGRCGYFGRMQVWKKLCFFLSSISTPHAHKGQALCPIGAQTSVKKRSGSGPFSLFPLNINTTVASIMRGLSMEKGCQCRSESSTHASAAAHKQKGGHWITNILVNQSSYELWLQAQTDKETNERWKKQLTERWSRRPCGGIRSAVEIPAQRCKAQCHKRTEENYFYTSRRQQVRTSEQMHFIIHFCSFFYHFIYYSKYLHSISQLLFRYEFVFFVVGDTICLYILIVIM